MSLQLTQHLIGDSTISYVAAPLISVPNTTISNRAQIRDLSQDQGARMGIERIMVQQPVELPNEFGSGGEKVFKALNDDRELIRFVGGWGQVVSNYGFAPQSTANTTDYLEITFYGTGLNLLHASGAAAYDARASVDGAAEGSNIFGGVTTSGILIGRNYASNMIVPIVAGLSIGLHTIKIRNNSGSLLLTPYGFEILNESSSIRINSGKLVKDQRQISLESTITQAFKPSTLSGTRGGRVVVYNQGGLIGTAVQAVDASSGILAATNHSNEEIIRTYSFREFGAARSDDFSLLSPSGIFAGFTLDDGSTSLVGSNVRTEDPQVMFANGNGQFWQLHFVGTGIDIMIIDDSPGGADNYNVQIDGGATQNLSGTGVTTFRILKIASGLPYGSHTLKFNRVTAATFNRAMSKFVVYGPKKPTLPAGAVEIADYNVMADFVANANGVGGIATGVLRKAGVREFTYVEGTGGTSNWGIGGADSMQELISDRLNAYAEYTFFGTGFDLRFRINSGRSATTGVSLQSLSTGGSLVALTSANFATATFATIGTGTGYNSGTGVLDQQDASAQDHGGFRTSGLPLGLYKVRFNNNTAGTYTSICSLDIITPIHAPKSNIIGDLQNTLPVGSCALQDSRQYTLANLVPQKVRSMAQGVASNFTTTSTSYTPVNDMSLTVISRGGWFKLTGMVNAYNGTNATYISLFLNGAQVGPDATVGINAASCLNVTTDVYLPAGAHKIDIQWKVNAGTGTIYNSGSGNGSRILTVEEL